MKAEKNGQDLAIQSSQVATHRGTSEVDLTTPQFLKEVSERKKLANRENSLKSTGPRTAAGKRRVAQNAVTHGLLSRELVVLDKDGKESQVEFEKLLAEIRKDRRPEGVCEEIFVEKLAICLWRIRRSLRYESGQIAKELSSYRQHLQQKDHLTSLAEELSEGAGMPPRSTELDSMVDHLALPSRADTDKLVRYQLMINKELNHAVAELEKLQRHRKGEARPAPTRW